MPATPRHSFCVFPLYPDLLTQSLVYDFLDCLLSLVPFLAWQHAIH